MLSPLLQQAVDALGGLDAERLEQLCGEVEALVRDRREECVQAAVETRALRRTLFELLRTTDSNLRLLRELRDLRIRSLEVEGKLGDQRWVR